MHQPHDCGRAIPYSDQELFTLEPSAPSRGKYLNEIAFPLGGIGTGCMSLSGRGELVDWEIFNRPNKGYRPANSYFLLFARPDESEPVFRVMEGRLAPPYQGWMHGAPMYKGFGFGPPCDFGSGFLRFADCSFTGNFPFCCVDLADDTVPVQVALQAWSPFIPLDEDSSSLPVAVFDITLTNVTDRHVAATAALGLQNMIGWPDTGQGRNEWIEAGNCRGLVMTTEKHPPDSPRYGTMALLTPHPHTTHQLRFEDTHWFAITEGLMDQFGTTGRFSGVTEPRTSPEHEMDTAHIGLQMSLEPGQSATASLVLAWLMPNFELYWGPNQGATWKTHQGNTWESAEAVACHVIEHLPDLRERSRGFADAFASSTLPTYVTEAISTQMAILRSPTVTRLPDGTLYGFEGCCAEAGCCEGSCTHVWTYAQTIAYLFPRLERRMRDMDFAVNLREEDGHMQFRMALPPGTAASHMTLAAADGQMGNVLRVYREWLISGDEVWLTRLWPSVKKALEYAWVEWDQDRDGLLEGVHHNTLDIEYHGPETACGSMYLAALLAAEQMARHLDDHQSANEYRRIFQSGSTLSDQRLFNGEYYFQLLPEDIQVPYQYGDGCLCDQVLGQWHARMYGLGDLYNPENIRSAIASVFRYNFRDNFHAHHNPHRVYALNDDRGLLICTWPRGGRPERSVTYAFECMIGFEYQVGAHLIYEGYLREGLAVCKAIRDRHDGHRRNPYNEFECGSHYARSLANYSYLLALSGFRYSAPTRTLQLNPAIFTDNFNCFFSVEGAWGTINYRKTQKALALNVQVIEGELLLDSLLLDGGQVECAGTRVTPAEPFAVQLTDA